MGKFDDALGFYNNVLNIEPENIDAKESLKKLEKYQLVLVTGELDQTNIEIDSKGYSNPVKIKIYYKKSFQCGKRLLSN